MTNIPKVTVSNHGFFTGGTCHIEGFGMADDKKLGIKKPYIRCYSTLVAFFLRIFCPGKIFDAQTANGKIIPVKRSSYDKWRQGFTKHVDAGSKLPSLDQIIAYRKKVDNKIDFFQRIDAFHKQDKVDPRALIALLLANKDYLKSRNLDLGYKLTAIVTKFDPAIKSDLITKQTKKIVEVLCGPELLPELKKMILEQLPLNDLANAAQSKEWGEVAKKLILEKMAIGEKEWKQHFPEVALGKIPALPKDIAEILKAPCPFWPDKKVSETHKLVLVPAGLSINSVGKLMGPKINDKANAYRYIWDRIVATIGDQPIEKSHWVLMPVDVIPGSRGLSFEKQKALIKGKCPEYEAPSAVDAIVVTLMNYVCSGEKQERLLPAVPWTYTRCKEDFGGRQLVVGAFAPSGLHVFDYDDGRDGIGVSAVRKFC